MKSCFALVLTNDFQFSLAYIILLKEFDGIRTLLQLVIVEEQQVRVAHLAFIKTPPSSTFGFEEENSLRVGSNSAFTFSAYG
jgi:hypothetical protein